MLRWTVAGAAGLAALGTTAHGQSADALIDKLVEKGILSDAEAQDLREEADRGFTTAYQVKSGMSDWVTALKINGDFRGRVEGFYADPDVPFVDRTRFRYRLRLGVVAVLQDQFELGLRLASGDIDNATSVGSGIDPISTNQSLQNNASKKGIFLDLAYAKWSFLNSPAWFASATAGKMENPFVFSDMVFDGDYTPEGLGTQWGYRFSDAHSLKFNAGAFVLDEIGGDSDDPFLAAAQVRWDGIWNTWLSSTAGVAALGVANEENLPNGAVPNVNRGNTRVDPGGFLVYAYNPLVIDVATTFTVPEAPLYTGPFPIRVAADLIHNPGAPDNNTGYSVGVAFGKAGKRKTWEISYTYKHLEGDAWYEEFVDSDFGAVYQTAPPGGSSGYQAGTNVKGHIVRVAYSPYDSLTLSVKWFGTELIDASPEGSESGMNRLQTDLLWRF